MGVRKQGREGVQASERVIVFRGEVRGEEEKGTESTSREGRSCAVRGGVKERHEIWRPINHERILREGRLARKRRSERAPQCFPDYLHIVQSARKAFAPDLHTKKKFIRQEICNRNGMKTKGVG